MRLLKFLAFAVCGLWTTGSNAAEITLRPDLNDRLAAMEWVYPGRDVDAAYLTEFPPFWFDSEMFPDRPVVHINGPIQKGDDAKLAEFLEKNLHHSMVFVLDSPGGNFLEALNMGARLKSDPTASDPYDWRFVVLDGTSCLSACALILAMADGMIETRATVGFHMGILPESQAQSSAQVQEVMNLTYDIALEYTALINDGAKPAVLLREALKHRSADSFFYLRGGMRSWAMGFTPVSSGQAARTINLVGLDEGTAMRLCQTLTYGTYHEFPEPARRMVDHFGDIVPLLPDSALLLRDVFERLGTDRIANNGPEGVATCTYERSESGLVSVHYSGAELGGLFESNGNCVGDERVQLWCAAGEVPTTPVSTRLLADALGCSGGRLLVGEGREESQWFPEFILVPKQRKGTAKRDVNVRKSPGLSTGPIGVFPQGAEAAITNCALTDDRQGVWFEIDSGTLKGWVSARFLLETEVFPVPVVH